MQSVSPSYTQQKKRTQCLISLVEHLERWGGLYFHKVYSPGIINSHTVEHTENKQSEKVFQWNICRNVIEIHICLLVKKGISPCFLTNSTMQTN